MKEFLRSKRETSVLLSALWGVQFAAAGILIALGAVGGVAWIVTLNAMLALMCLLAFAHKALRGDKTDTLLLAYLCLFALVTAAKYLSGLYLDPVLGTAATVCFVGGLHFMMIDTAYQPRALAQNPIAWMFVLVYITALLLTGVFGTGVSYVYMVFLVLLVALCVRNFTRKKEVSLSVMMLLFASFWIVINVMALIVRIDYSPVAALAEPLLLGGFALMIVRSKKEETQQKKA